VSRRIVERRKNSANVPEADRAEVVQSENKKKSSLLKWIIVAILAIIIVAAIVIIVMNASVKNLANTVAPEGNYKDTYPTADKSAAQGKAMYTDEVQNSDLFAKYALYASKNYNNNADAIVKDENVYNYVLYGVEKVDAGDPHVDLIMIASLNKNSGAVKYVLLDPETLVYIPFYTTSGARDGGEIGLLRDAYNFGGSKGANLLSRTISQNYGIDVAGYGEFDLVGAANMIDKVGGIDLELTAAEKANFNSSVAQYNARFGTDVVVPEGNHFIGQQAVAYVVTTPAADRTAATFKVLVEVTKASIKGGRSATEDFFKSLVGNANASVEASELDTVIGVIAKTTGEAIANSLKTVDLGVETEVHVSTNGVSFISYEGFEAYSAVVKALHDVLFK